MLSSPPAASPAARPSPTAALPMFTPSDMTAIAAWIMARPLGLGGDVAGDHDGFGDVFEVTRGNPNAPLYFVAPRRSGGLEVSPGHARREAFKAGAGGAGEADRVETATVADIAAALALVERVEVRALGGGR